MRRRPLRRLLQRCRMPHRTSSSACAASSTGSPAEPGSPMLELILGILLAAGATYFVLLPILRPPVESPGGEAAGDEGDDPADDMSPQMVALRALKEIEFDRATGKLSDADYGQLKAKYTQEALAAMRGEGAPYAVSGARESPAREPLTAHRAQCPKHGPRPEKDAQFCS